MFHRVEYLERCRLFCQKALSLLYLPGREVGLRLDAAFYLVVKGGEEVDARDTLYLVYGAYRLTHRLTTAVILIDKADGRRMLTHT